jgi:hypothetical protein
MESIQEDIKYVYWTDAISNYSASLDVQSISNDILFTVGNSSYPFIAQSGDCIFLLDEVAQTLTQQRSFSINSNLYNLIGTTVPLITFTGGLDGSTGATGPSWVLDGNGFTIDLTDLGNTLFYSLVRSGDDTLFTINNIKIVGDLSNLTMADTDRGIIVDNAQRYVIVNNCYVHSSSNLSTTAGIIAGDYFGIFGKSQINNCGVGVDIDFIIGEYVGGIVGSSSGFNGECHLNGCYVYVKGNITINQYGGGIVGYGGCDKYTDDDQAYAEFTATNCFIKSLKRIIMYLGSGGIVSTVGIGVFSLSNCAVLANSIRADNVISGGIVCSAFSTNTSTISNCAFMPTTLFNANQIGAIYGSVLDINLNVSNCYSSVNLPLVYQQIDSSSSITTWTNCYTISQTFGNFSNSSQNTFNYCVYDGIHNPNIGLYNLSVFDLSNVLTLGILSTWSSDWIMPAASNRPILNVFQNKSWNDIYAFSTGSAGGDPYITTLENQEFYKLPGKIRNYRLFQSEKCVINASVAPIKTRDAENLLRAFKDVEGFTPKTDGFYFDAYYIQIGKDHIHFNERIELVSVSETLEFMYIKTYPELKTENINGMSSSYFLTEILVQDSSCKNLLVQLKRDLNPQIVNGISIQVGDKELVKHTTGALVRRSNPRNYEIKELTRVNRVNETKYPTSKNYHVKKETFYSKQVVGLKIL